MRGSLVWPHLINFRAVLVHQALGALPVPAVLSSPTSSEGVWTGEVSNSVRATPTRILTANLTEEVRSVETPPRHREGPSPEGTALRVPAAAGSLQRQIDSSPRSLNLPEFRRIARQRTEGRGRRWERELGSWWSVRGARRTEQNQADLPSWIHARAYE